MSGMWKRSHGRTSEAPPDERGGYRYVRPTVTAPHLDSTHLPPCRPSRQRSLHSADSGQSGLATGTGLHALHTGHSTTSPARAMSESETLSPSAFAVFRLMASSNLV